MPVIGRSYSLFTGEGWLPYVLGAVPAAAGISPANAVKRLFGVSFVAGSAGAYFWTRRRLGDGWAALVAASVYVFNPIFLSTVYTLGDLAAAVLLGLAPWVLWAADAAMDGRRSATIALALLSAFILWTQAGLAIAFLLIVVGYLMVIWRAGRLSLRQAGTAVDRSACRAGSGGARDVAGAPPARTRRVRLVRAPVVDPVHAVGGVARRLGRGPLGCHAAGAGPAAIGRAFRGADRPGAVHRLPRLAPGDHSGAGPICAAGHLRGERDRAPERPDGRDARAGRAGGR